MGIKTYGIYNDRGKDGAGYSLAILGILLTTNELLMPTPVQTSDDTENNNREYGHDNAEMSPR